MANPQVQAQGKEFVAGVLQHLPDALRAQMETFLATPDATAFVTEVGNGALRQADYSRRMNEVQDSHRALKKWHGELTDWVATMQAGDAAPLAPATGTAAAAPTVTAGVSPDDVRQTINQELGRREVYFAAFTAEAVRLAQDHMRMFGETLDINTLLQHPRLGELRLDGAYAEVFKDKLAAHKAAADAKAREALEAEIRGKVLAEIRQQPASGGLPYVLGESSTLDGLTPTGETAKPFDPNAALAMYEGLVGAKA
jgi:hypothetical protein